MAPLQVITNRCQFSKLSYSTCLPSRPSHLWLFETLPGQEMISFSGHVCLAEPCDAVKSMDLTPLPECTATDLVRWEAAAGRMMVLDRSHQLHLQPCLCRTAAYQHSRQSHGCSAMRKEGFKAWYSHLSAEPLQSDHLKAETFRSQRRRRADPYGPVAY